MYQHINNLSRESIPTRLVQNSKKSPNKFKLSDLDTRIIKKNKSINDEEKKILPNVIVLADDKNYSRKFLTCLGMTSGSPFLCTAHIPTKMFTFQIYGLEESDEKIFSHVKENAGLVIITTNNNYNKLLERIKFYTMNISHIPILIVIEDIKNLDHINKTSKQNVRYEFNFEQHISSYTQLDLCDGLSWFNECVKKFKPLPKNILELKELVKQFVDCELSVENWNHFNRLRLVYFSLKNYGYDKTIDKSGWLCVNWNKYKNTIGHAHLWNYTLTKFWIDQIHILMLKNYQMDFAQLYNRYEYLSDGNLHKKYYSNEILFSEKAKNEWVNPDKIVNN